MKLCAIPAAVVSLTLLTLPLPATAGDADVCYGAQASAMAAPKLSAEMRFSCSSAGNATLPQLAADGWRIVHLSLVTTTPTAEALTGSPASIEAAWLLVIEKH
jgi:hypothetical protein